MLGESPSTRIHRSPTYLRKRFSRRVSRSRVDQLCIYTVYICVCRINRTIKNNLTDGKKKKNVFS